MKKIFFLPNLMKKFSCFHFERFEFDTTTLTAHFFYHFDNILFFEETICFGDSNFLLRKDLEDDIIQTILFHMQIALGISYYKFYPTKDLVIHTGKLSPDSLEFWKKFYLNGLGEFFYTNQMDPSELLHFTVKSDREFLKKDFGVSQKFLVPIGGGKDSIVSLELLKQFGQKIDGVTFAQNDNILYENTAQHAGIKRLFLHRQLSKNISSVIAEGAYNGHVPITGIIAFVLELACYLYDYKYIVLSNEKSANFGNTVFAGVSINHQWSKSGEFERDFGKYVQENISSDIQYFSLLRPFYELKIAQLFSKYARIYFQDFSSCNTNFKILKKYQKNSYWCNECPKCLFVYIILSAFLSYDDMISIFGKDLYQEEKLETLFRELSGISGIKPFECVGTNEEVILALQFAYEKREGKIPFLLEIFKNEIHSKMVPDDYQILKQKILTPDFEENMIPNFLIEKLKATIK